MRKNEELFNIQYNEQKQERAKFKQELDDLRKRRNSL